MISYRFKIETTIEAESAAQAVREFKKTISLSSFNITDRTEDQESQIDEMGYYNDEGVNYSGCCGAVVYPDTDICSDCKEHV